MERAVALRRLRKVLGKGAGYRIDPKAPTPEEREAAQALNKELADRRQAAIAARDARYKFILANDAEYQTLAAAATEARKTADGNFSKQHHFKITVGTTDRLFFRVRAQGDSWEEIFDKLAKDK